jgi:hypothetical protein
MAKLKTHRKLEKKKIKTIGQTVRCFDFFNCESRLSTDAVLWKYYMNIQQKLI